MPQWRKLHVKTVDSMDVNDMPDDFTRLLWVMLPLALDSKGRGIDEPVWVRSKVFPLRTDVSEEKVGRAMEWYEKRGMISRYEVNGRYYFEVPTFTKYQGNTEREAASVIPDPVRQAKKKPREQVTTNSRPTHDQLATRSSSDVDVDADKHVGVPPTLEIDLTDHTPEPDAVKELAVTFERVSGIKLPNPTGKKGQATIGVTWWHPLREMVRLGNGTAAQTLKAAVLQMRRDNLTIASPKSCEKVFLSLHGAAATKPASQFIEYSEP